MTYPADALATFYAQEGLPADGGISATTDRVTAFGVPMTIPNPPLRARVLPIHDLHHLLTGYGTDEVGEGEVSAWALGAGNRHHLFGLVYDSGAFLIGLLQGPRRLFSAFVRGRRGRTLYDQPAAHWMDMTVEALAAHCGVDVEVEADWRDRLAFAITVPLAMGIATLLPVVSLVGVLRGGERPAPFVGVSLR